MLIYIGYFIQIIFIMELMCAFPHKIFYIRATFGTNYLNFEKND